VEPEEEPTEMAEESTSRAGVLIERTPKRTVGWIILVAVVIFAAIVYLLRTLHIT